MYRLFYLYLISNYISILSLFNLYFISIYFLLLLNILVGLATLGCGLTWWGGWAALGCSVLPWAALGSPWLLLFAAAVLA